MLRYEFRARSSFNVHPGGPVLSRVLLGFPDYALDLFLRQTGRRRYRNSLLCTGRGIFGRCMDYAVYVDIECYFNSGYAARRGRNSFQLKVRQELIICRDFPFPLVDLDVHRSLIMAPRGKNLALAGGEWGV